LRNGIAVAGDWCHGAAGIGFSRVGLAAEFGLEPELRSEIRHAASTTLGHVRGTDHSLCHGDLGRLEFLRSAGDLLGDESLLQAYRNGVSVTLDTLENGDWRTGVPHSVETPGLMTGLAGIGFGLLRIAHLDAVPNILIMEGPRG
jgi:lantibiotic modifying enzyme